MSGIVCGLLVRTEQQLCQDYPKGVQSFVLVIYWEKNYKFSSINGHLTFKVRQRCQNYNLCIKPAFWGIWGKPSDSKKNYLFLDLRKKKSAGLSKLLYTCPEGHFEEEQCFEKNFMVKLFADYERKLFGKEVKTALYVSRRLLEEN